MAIEIQESANKQESNMEIRIRRSDGSAESYFYRVPVLRKIRVLKEKAEFMKDNPKATDDSYASHIFLKYINETVSLSGKSIEEVIDAYDLAGKGEDSIIEEFSQVVQNGKSD